MASFKDKAGREWNVEITYDTIRRVEKALKVNLLGIIDGTLANRLAADVMLLVDVVYVVCKPELDAASVSDVEFGKAMGGDSLDDATRALLDGIVDFFPNGKRLILREMLSRMREVRDQLVNETVKLVRAPSLIPIGSSGEDGGLPDSSDSPAVRGPSASGS